MNHFSQDQLKSAFEIIENPEDWRAEINALIDPKLEDVVTQAIIHFTATVPGIKKEGDKLRVTSVGYRMGPAGP